MYMIFCIPVTIGTSETGGVLERVGAGICEATGCCDSGCGADNASVLRERKSHKQINRQARAEASTKPLLTVTFPKVSTV